MYSETQRNIPFWVAIALFFSNPLSILGVLFVAIGGFATYMMSDDLFSTKNIENTDPITQGIVTRVIANEYTTDDDETIITYKCYYEFKTDWGEKIKGSSEHNEKIAESGDTFSVQYNPDNPKESRLTDFKETDSSYLYMILIFPLIGIITIIFPLIDVIKKLRIMRIGQSAYGTYEGKRDTGSRINGRKVYEMFFKFTCTNGKEYEIKTKTHRKKRLQDEEKELIIFDPQNPENAFPVDVLPNFAKQFIVEYDKSPQPNMSLWVRILRFRPRTKVAKFGLAFTILGGIASILLFINIINTRKNIKDNDPVTQAIVTNIKYANATINNKAVCEYFYEFTTASGEKVTSSSKHFEGIAEQNDILSVQYNPDNPKEARFTDFEEANLNLGIYIALFFFLTGIMILGFEIINTSENKR